MRLRGPCISVQLKPERYQPSTRPVTLDTLPSKPRLSPYGVRSSPAYVNSVATCNVVRLSRYAPYSPCRSAAPPTAAPAGLQPRRDQISI